VPEEGGLITWSWFKTYDQAPSREPSDWVVASWDTAMKDHEVNDYSVGIVALAKPNGRVVILDVIRERLNFPALRTRILEEAQKRVGTVTLIEDAGSGTALLQDLQRCMPVVPRRPFGDKVMRFNAVTPTIEGGQVHLPARAPWLDAFKRELLSFPASANDDQVDALSQLLNWVKERTTYRHLQTTYGAFA
jgi:predicted phage terminase large subunit-like protein